MSFQCIFSASRGTITSIRRGEGFWLQRGWRSHAQSAHSPSRDPLLSRDPLPLSPSQKGAGGAPARRGVGVPARRGVGVLPRRGVGVPARGVLRPVGGQEVWEYHKPGTPHERPLAFSQSKLICLCVFLSIVFFRPQ